MSEQRDPVQELNGWQGEILIEVALTLEALGCKHGNQDMKSTPPATAARIAAGRPNGSYIQEKETTNELHRSN